jgi:hypothetical protein
MCALAIQTSYWQHGCDKSLQPSLKQLIRNANAHRVLCGGQRVLDDILDIQVCPDLVEILPQIDDLCVCEHDKLHARRCLVVVQLVFASAVGEEGVVVAAELGDHVAQGEDEAKHELLVVGLREGLARGRSVAIARDARGRLGARRLAR